MKKFISILGGETIEVNMSWVKYTETNGNALIIHFTDASTIRVKKPDPNYHYECISTVRGRPNEGIRFWKGVEITESLYDTLDEETKEHFKRVESE